MFTTKDIKQIEAKGMSLEQVENQLKNFKTGFPFIKLKAAATPGKGLKTFSEDETKELIANYTNSIAEKSLIKFVPASGAASRMFKHLFEFREELQKGKTLNLSDDSDFNSVAYFFSHIKNFAFYSDLGKKMKSKGLNINDKLEQKDYLSILNNLLDEDGLEYATLPKGLLKFHPYTDKNRLAIEEHLVEGAVYGKDDNNKVNLHFTVSPEHQTKFEEVINEITPKYANQYNIEPELILSIIHVESYFNPKAISHANAIGLMQLVPTSGGQDSYKYVYGKREQPSRKFLFNSDNNINLGTAYLKILMTEYFANIVNKENKRHCVVSSYNTGIGNAFFL